MPTHDIIAIGASAGGINALQTIAAELPSDLPASVLIAMHLHPSSPGVLPQVLRRAGPLPAANAEDGEPLVRGRIYVAPPDRHLLVSGKGRLQLSRGPKENLTRPAVDPLFRSVALAFGPRVIGVVLTGYLDDGAVGLRAIKLCGGTCVVQDPRNAEAAGMPSRALSAVRADYCVPLEQVAPLLARLARTEAIMDRERIMPRELEIEAAIAAGDTEALAGLRSISSPSLFTCPECHGVLSELRESNPPRFRCHTGHAFSSESLREALYEKAEDALWNAVRVLQERAMLMKHLATHARNQGDLEDAATWEREADAAASRAEHVRRIQAGSSDPTTTTAD